MPTTSAITKVTGEAEQQQQQQQEQQQQQQQLLPLLFGIEIETLIALPPTAEQEGYISLVGDEIVAVSNHFHSQGLDCAIRSAFMTSYDKWSLTGDGSLHPEHDPAALEAAFPHCFGPSQPSASEWYERAIELVSRPMPIPSLTSTPADQEEWAEAKAFYHALLSGSHTTPSPSFVAHQSAECGLHIHIGLQDNEPFPLPLLQQLAILVLTYEDVISTLHPPHRVPYAMTQASVYAMSNRIGVRKSAHSCRDATDLTTSEIKRRVMGCATVAELCWLMASSSPLDEDLNPTCPMDPTGAYATNAAAADAMGWGVAPISPSCTQWDTPDSFGAAFTAEQASIADSGYHSASAEGKPLLAMPPGWEVPPASEQRSWPPPPETVPWRDDAPVLSSQEKQQEEQCSSDARLDSIQYGEKYRLTRWNLLPCLGRSKDCARTIEFRQPSGTLDHREAAGWVQLYGALVRAAERRAQRAADLACGEEGAAEEEFEEELGTLEGLLRILRLPEEVCEYWRGRQGEMAVERERVEGEDEAGRKVGDCDACWLERGVSGDWWEGAGEMVEGGEGGEGVEE